MFFRSMEFNRIGCVFSVPYLELLSSRGTKNAVLESAIHWRHWINLYVHSDFFLFIGFGSREHKAFMHALYIWSMLLAFHDLVRFEKCCLLMIMSRHRNTF